MVAVLDHTDRIEIDDPARGPSSVTLFAFEPSVGAVALCSGHGVLPSSGGRFRFVQGAQPLVRARVVDGSGAAFVGRVTSGEVTEHNDFTIVKFAGVAFEKVWKRHFLAGYPIGIRGTPLMQGDEIHHYSRTRRRLYGKVAMVEVRERVWFRGAGWHRFEGLTVVERIPGFPRFSKAGESGSLAVDIDGNAVGVVVAGRSDGSKSYVLPLDGLRSTLGGHFSWFFEEPT